MVGVSYLPKGFGRGENLLSEEKSSVNSLCLYVIWSHFSRCWDKQQASEFKAFCCIGADADLSKYQYSQFGDPAIADR